jgi:hypothetical protein
MRTLKPINVAQYLSQHAPWLMPELISTMNVNKHLKLDHLSGKELTRQHLIKQGDPHE